MNNYLALQVVPRAWVGLFYRWVGLLSAYDQTPADVLPTSHGIGARQIDPVCPILGSQSRTDYLNPGWLFPLCRSLLSHLPIHNSPFPANTSTEETAKDAHKGESIMKATGIVRRVDDLGRIVIPKEIRRTLRIREGDPLQTSLTQWEKYCFSMLDLAKRRGW